MSKLSKLEKENRLMKAALIDVREENTKVKEDNKKMKQDNKKMKSEVADLLSKF